MNVNKKNVPCFRTEKYAPGVEKVFLLCSLCGKDIRELDDEERIDITAPYFHPDCEVKNDRI